MNTRAWNLIGGDGPARSLAQAGRLFALLLVFAGLLAGQGMAQSYPIDWYAIDGGGGTSTNGPYSLTGAIGQAGTGGPMTNAKYSLTGGFWVLPAVVQEPGAPILTVAPAAPGFALISWTPNTAGFGLSRNRSRWSLPHGPIPRAAPPTRSPCRPLWSPGFIGFRSS